MANVNARTRLKPRIALPRNEDRTSNFEFRLAIASSRRKNLFTAEHPEDAAVKAGRNTENFADVPPAVLPASQLVQVSSASFVSSAVKRLTLL
jgi:hypothetical protein